MDCLPLLNSAIPDRQPDVPGDVTTAPLEQPIRSESISIDLQINFPSNFDKLPISGGAIISFPISNFNISPDPKIDNIITKDLKDISKLILSYSLNSLSDFQVGVNKGLYDIARKDYKVMAKRANAPNVYLSIYQGEDPGSINENIYIPFLNKMCEFRYIPFQTFSVLFDSIKNAQGYLGDQKSFKDLVGVAGRKFSQLESIIKKETLTDAEVTDFILEFFPIGNLSEDDILSTKDVSVSGYYTIINDKVFLKMPDLTTRNSAGVSDPIINADSLLYFETYFNATVSRVQVKNFAVPPTASILEYEDNFPASGDLFTLSFKGVGLDQGVKVYLSPVITSLSRSEEDIPYSASRKSKYITGFNNGIEIYSAPILTVGLEDGRDAIIDSGEQGSIIELSNAMARKYISNKSWGEYQSSKDFAFINIPYSNGLYRDNLLRSIDPYSFFGIKNRPEIMLSTTRGFSSLKNDKKYYNLSSYGKINILSSLMPKFYNNIPKSWISKDLIAKSDSEEDYYSAEFGFDDFDGIDLEKITGEIRYAVYIGDQYGQITRAKGGLVSLSKEKPSILSITPNGFDDSKVIYYNEFESQTLEISGSDLDGVTSIKITALTSGESFSFSGDADNVNITSKLIQIILPQSFFNDNFSFISQKFSIEINCGLAGTVKDYIYVVTTPDQSRPLKDSELLNFGKKEFYSAQFGKGNPIVGIPLFKDGVNAKIKISSVSKLFKNKSDLFAYIAIPDSESLPLEKIGLFAFENRVAKFQSDYGSLYIPLDIVYSFNDFDKKSNKNAILNFPGKKYSKYNFSILNSFKKAYIIFTNQLISDLGLQISSPDTIENFSYSIIPLGDATNPPFIEPFSIIDIAAKDSSNKVMSTFSKDRYPSDLFVQNFTEDFIVEPISLSKKLKNLLIIVSGINDSFLKTGYEFYLGSEKINKYLCRKPVMLAGGKIGFEFKNISPKESGNLQLLVIRKNSPYVSKYTSKGTYTQGTLMFVSRGSSESFELDPDDSSIIVNADVGSLSTFTQSSFFEEYQSSSVGLGVLGLSSYEFGNVIDCIYPDTTSDGVIFDPTNTEKLYYKTLLPISLRPSISLSLILNDREDNYTNIPANLTADGINLIQRNGLILSSGNFFYPESYSYYEENRSNQINKYFLLFFDIYNEGFASIKFDVPEVIKYSRLNEAFKRAGESIRLVVGDVYRFVVKNTGRFFSIIINGISIRPNSPPEYDPETGGYVATVTIPEEMIEFSEVESVEISASSTNEELNSAEYILTGEFIENTIDLCNKSFDKLPGQEIFDRIKNFALSIAGFKLDLPLPAKVAINSFCDLSFDLQKELKYALNGFRTLMVPVQVIFCIIDVICSLINPVKLAKAVIRLFECIYDLVSLIPAISVPVMFLQLTLHALELFKCVFDKISLTINAVNDICNGIANVFRKPKNLTALKSLEETLEQYLNDIDLDLKFLDPLVSILDIFLQLLQLVFRFPCKVSSAEGEPDCGVDGTMLAGLVVGTAAPESVINPDVLIPVAQTYTTDAEGNMDFSLDPTVGVVVANESGETFLESMEVDGDSLRANGGFAFNATFAPCFTKSNKKGKKSGRVTFKFNHNGKGNNTYIDANQTTDSPFALFKKVGEDLVIAESGNMYSPIDGLEFLEVDSNGNKASVKPLVLTFEIPITQVDETSGEIIQVGSESIERTFDNIPMMAIIDDESNVYFIEKDGIKFNSDGFVKEISAKIINESSVPKFSFVRENVEIGGANVNFYEFPQLYFFDMRQVGEDLQQYCVTTSINSFPLEDNNAEDILNIVQVTQECLFDWRANIQNLINQVRRNQQGGSPDLGGISLSQYDNFNQEVVRCLERSADDICKYVVNSLNTSFKVREDRDFTPKKDFVDGVLPDTILEGFLPSGPPFTGAREYAAGIGDNGVVDSGSYANIEIIPRDAYDNELPGDFSEKIVIEIVSDATGGAEFIAFDGGSIVSKVDNIYIAKLTSNGVGEVRIKAKICERVIQALMYADVDGQTTTIRDPGCVPGSVSELSSTSPPIGALTKVDRILSIFFKERPPVTAGIRESRDSIITEAQEFGTALEN